MTPKFEFGRDCCAMHIATEFHHLAFNCLEVILLTNKQTPLKAFTSLRCATPVGNQHAGVGVLEEMGLELALDWSC